MNSHIPRAGLLAAIALTGAASAQETEFVNSLGEQSGVLACQYACKAGPMVDGAATWRQASTLSLLNVSPAQALEGGDSAVVFVDSAGKFLGFLQPDLVQRDLDEINLCRTLQVAGIPVPHRGLLYVLDATSNLYAWMNTHVGLFPVTDDDPFTRTRATSESECRVTPPSIAEVFQVADALADSGAPQIPPVLIGESPE